MMVIGSLSLTRHDICVARRAQQSSRADGPEWMKVVAGHGHPSIRRSTPVRRAREQPMRDGRACAPVRFG
jgi:hypothetical protein